MSLTTAEWLSADHIFKVPANIGFWVNEKWIKIYDTFFIFLNQTENVNAWQLCKGSTFDNIRKILENLYACFLRQGQIPRVFLSTIVASGEI